MKGKPFKILFMATCAFYALASILFKGLFPTRVPGDTGMEQPAPIEVHTPLAATPAPGWMAWLVFSGVLLAFASVLAWFAWNNRHILRRGNPVAFATMLLLAPVMLKLAATKPNGSGGNTTSSGTNPGAQLNKPGTQNQGPGSTLQSTPSNGGTSARVATQPAYSLEAAAAAGASFTFTTNFFAGRLYPDPQIVVSRDGLHKTLSFAPNAFNNDNDDDDFDTPLGTLLAVYGLPPDIQAVVALVNLDGSRSPSRATLLRAPNLALQQAADHWDDPRTRNLMRRFQPVGADRRMFVNNTETRLAPRDGWCVITLEADSANPIDLTLGTIGGDGSHSMGGAYWPGRVAEIVFIPREWQPETGAPLEPVAWNATVRNALESYLLHKHRLAQPRYTDLPPEYTITHDKINLVGDALNLQKIKISGTLLIVR